MLTDREIERYDRQIIMEGVGKEGQERLKNAHVFLAGAGGLGSPIALLLVAAGIGRLTIVDEGAVEISNLNRQILYREDDVGIEKVFCAEKQLELLNSFAIINGKKEHINKHNVYTLISDSDIIIDAMDNYDARYILNIASFDNNIPLIHGAVEEFYGQVTMIMPGKTNCLQCLFPEAPPPQTWPIIGTTCGVIASIQATEAVKCILGIGNRLENRLLVWDGLHAKMEEFDLERSQGCAICGNESGGP